MLYEYKSISGLSLAVRLADKGDKQKVYDRLKGLRQNGLINNEVYIGITWEEKQAKKNKRPRKLGKMYYLTKTGVEQAKQIIYNQEINGNERSQKPDEKEIDSLWQVSLIMEHVPLEFSSGQRYKNAYNLQRNFIADLIYQDWYIVIAANSKEPYKNLLVQQAIQSKAKGIDTRLILCNSTTQIVNLMRYFEETHAPETHFLMQNDYEGIEQVVSSNKEKTIQALEKIYGKIERLQFPIEGYQYKVDGKLTNIYSLIGNPIRQLYKLPNALPGYIIVANPKQLMFLEKHFPQHIKKHTSVIISETNMTTKGEGGQDNWDIDLKALEISSP